MMDIMLFGMQGSGKGTQGQRLADHFGYKIFETGGALRALAEEPSPLGKKVKLIIEAGHLVSDDVVIEIVEDFLTKIKHVVPVIFDGIPRKMTQAINFDALMARVARSPVGLYIAISEQEAMKRLTTRKICSQCRSVYPGNYQETHCERCKGPLTTRADDTVESIQVRLKHYAEETLPVIHRYRYENRMIEINGEQPMDKVHQDIMAALDSWSSTHPKA